MESLKEKIVVVTGGAQGIGKGLARACLKRGARVVITNLDPAVASATVAELSEHGPIRAVRCDATDRAAVDDLFDDVWGTEGPVDLAFCNAGAGGMGQILETPMKDVHHQFSTNLYSAIHMAQSYIPRLVEANRAGHVMFTGSENSLVLPPANADLAMGIYGGTKHALLAVAEWLRYELRDTAVTVSLLMPGPVLTERLAATFEALAHDPDNPEIRGRFPEHVERTLRERFISPDECAEIALRGLAQELFFIPTQAYIRDDVDARYREVCAAFDALGLS